MNDVGPRPLPIPPSPSSSSAPHRPTRRPSSRPSSRSDSLPFTFPSPSPQTAISSNSPLPADPTSWTHAQLIDWLRSRLTTEGLARPVVEDVLAWLGASRPGSSGARVGGLTLDGKEFMKGNKGGWAYVSPSLPTARAPFREPDHLRVQRFRSTSPVKQASNRPSTPSSSSSRKNCSPNVYAARRRPFLRRTNRTRRR